MLDIGKSVMVIILDPSLFMLFAYCVYGIVFMNNSDSDTYKNIFLYNPLCMIEDIKSDEMRFTTFMPTVEYRRTQSEANAGRTLW